MKTNLDAANLRHLSSGSIRTLGPQEAVQWHKRTGSNARRQVSALLCASRTASQTHAHYIYYPEYPYSTNISVADAKF